MTIYLKRLAYLFLLLFLVLSCSDDDQKPEESILIEATPFLTRTASELQFYLRTAGVKVDTSTFRYDVELYKVKYKTTFKNEPITASGVVIIPKTNDAVGMLSFQHGTISAHRDAPSALPLNNTELILYAALGSAGFIGVAPDFIGFGESNTLLHPYYVEEATATPIIDNLKAARELATQKSVKFNKKLFLAGYSQGGYATMATHKAIETNSLKNFELIASFPASGGYDVKGMQTYFFHQTTYDQPHYIAYVALAYQNYYEWSNSLQQFFNEPYAALVPGLFNGSNNAGAINAQLTNNISNLIKADLLQHIDTDPKYQFLVDAFNENSLLDWTPTKKMFMYHGDADITVPYENSVDTYNYFISHGASADIVTFTNLPGATHGTGVIPYVENFFSVLMTLK